MGRAERSGSRRPRPGRAALPVVVCLAPRRLPSADVLSYRGDPQDDGQEPLDPALTPVAVDPSRFGKLFAVAVDGQVFAEPLFAQGVPITVGSGRGLHDVVFVATEDDSVYALDAGDGAVLWEDHFTDPAAGVTAVPSRDLEFNQNIAPVVGITGTPVIDRSTATLFVVAETKEVRGGQAHYVQRLHALRLADGAEATGSPATIADTVFAGGTYVYGSGPTITGVGDGSVGGRLTYNAMRQNQRDALTLAGGVVYIASASHNDIGPYHGWILGYRASDLALVAAFNDTPNGSQGGIWQGGGPIAVDPGGDLYVAVGNGTFETVADAAGFPGRGDFGNAVLRLRPDPTTSPARPGVNGWGLKVIDYFVPHDQQALNDTDTDLGGGAPVILPDSAGNAAHPRTLTVAGKGGLLYLLDRDQLGRFDPGVDHVIQEVDVGPAFTTGAAIDGQLLYAPASAPARALPIAGAAIGAPTSRTAETFGFPGAVPAITADGAGDSLVWMIDHGADALRAYDAADLSRTLYDSDSAPGGRDRLGPTVKFTVPTVADGRVFVGADGALVAFGPIGLGRTSSGRRIAPGDVDGDGRTDLALFDQTLSIDYAATAGGPLVRPFGSPEARLVPVAGDFDGDGKADLAAYSPVFGAYYITYSSGKPGLVLPLGNPSDTNLPVAGDFDGDGRSDPALFDQSTGTYIVDSSGGGPTRVIGFGNSTARMVPVAGDFDGDGRTDLAAYSLTYGVLYIRFTGGPGSAAAIPLGNPADRNIPIVGDFDGDGKSDPALFDQTLGIYHLAPIGHPEVAHSFGNGDARMVPVSGDFDGDGRTDLAAYSLAFGVYFIAPSHAASFAQPFGNTIDRMLPEPGNSVPTDVQVRTLAHTIGPAPLMRRAGDDTPPGILPRGNGPWIGRVKTQPPASRVHRSWERYIFVPQRKLVDAGGRLAGRFSVD